MQLKERGKNRKMCIICVEIEKDRLTAMEASRNLSEMAEVIDDEQTYSVPCFMKETIKPIGGIGITVRWTYKGIKYDDHDEVGMLCMNIEDPAEFEDAVTSLTKHFVIKRDGEYGEDDEYGNCTSLIIFDAQHIIAVALYIEKYTNYLKDL